VLLHLRGKPAQPGAIVIVTSREPAS